MLGKILNKLNWTSGRRDGGYKIIRLFESKFFRCDSYLLYYQEGSSIAPHVDKVTEGKHYRINIELIKAKIGGQFILKGEPYFKLWRAVCFSPNEQEHQVTKIEKGYRLVFSIGWIKNKSHE